MSVTFKSTAVRDLITRRIEIIDQEVEMLQTERRELAEIIGPEDQLVTLKPAPERRATVEQPATVEHVDGPRKRKPMSAATKRKIRAAARAYWQKRNGHGKAKKAS